MKIFSHYVATVVAALSFVPASSQAHPGHSAFDITAGLPHPGHELELGTVLLVVAASALAACAVRWVAGRR